MKNRSVSLTGATGFLGWHIAEAFLRAGWAVRAIVRPGTRKPLPQGVAVRVAPLDAASLAPAFAQSDVVVHAAGLLRAATEAAFMSVNVGGTRAVVAAANEAGARLVSISSQAAAGPGTRDRPCHEHDRPRPLTAYGRSKLAGEQVVRAEARVPWTILRPAAVYGPRDRQFLPLFRLATRGWFVLAAPPATSFTLIHADDVARAVVTAAVDPRAIGETFFLGHRDPQTALDILTHIARVVGRDCTPTRVPPFALRALARGGDLLWRIGGQPLLDSDRLTELQAEGFVCAVDHARDVFGFSAETPLPEGFMRSWPWYRDHAAR